MFRDSWPKSRPLEPRTPVYHITWVPPPPGLYILPSFGSSNLQVALPCTRDAKICKLHCRVREWVLGNLIRRGNNPTKHIRVCARNWSNWREWITELWSEYARVSAWLCALTEWRTCVDLVVCVTPYCSAGYIGVLSSHWHCTDHFIFKANYSIRIRMFTAS